MASAVALSTLGTMASATDEDLGALNKGLKAQFEAGNKMTSQKIISYANSVVMMIKGGRFTAGDLVVAYVNLKRLKQTAKNNGWSRAEAAVDDAIRLVQETYKDKFGGNLEERAKKLEAQFAKDESISPFIPWDRPEDTK